MGRKPLDPVTEIPRPAPLSAVDMLAAGAPDPTTSDHGALPSSQVASRGRLARLASELAYRAATVVALTAIVVIPLTVIFERSIPPAGNGGPQVMAPQPVSQPTAPAP